MFSKLIITFGKISEIVSDQKTNMRNFGISKLNYAV